MKTRIAKFLALGMLALLVACGGGGGGDDSKVEVPATPDPVLRTLVVTPANSTISVGSTVQLVATGTYEDGTSAVITTGITWSAKGTAILNLFTTGLASGKAPGVEVVTAKVGSVTATTNVTVIGAYTAVSAGGGHTIVRRSTGGLLGWGSNNWGQIGDGTALAKSTPVSIGTVTTWTSIAAGDFHTVALRTDGTLWAWGNNQCGQLGDGTNINRLAPVKIGSSTNWVAVAAGQSHTLGVMKDGTLWAWGCNYIGQLGLGGGSGSSTTAITADQNAPKQVGSLATWASVAAGSAHSLARRKDGTLWVWGGNEKGQLAQGSMTAGTDIPVAVSAASPPLTFLAMATGANHSLAIRSNNTLYAWGSNENGQLGDSSLTGLQAEVVGQDKDWTIVSAGGSHSAAIKLDGTLWLWGSNAYGQVGDGTLSDAFAPSQIGRGNTWIAVSAGKYHTFAIQGDGSLWGWGRNQDGQLGNGTKSDIPVMVPTKLAN